MQIGIISYSIVPSCLLFLLSTSHHLPRPTGSSGPRAVFFHSLQFSSCSIKVGEITDSFSSYFSHKTQNKSTRRCSVIAGLSLSRKFLIAAVPYGPPQHPLKKSSPDNPSWVELGRGEGKGWARPFLTFSASSPGNLAPERFPLTHTTEQHAFLVRLKQFEALGN